MCIRDRHIPRQEQKFKARQGRSGGYLHKPLRLYDGNRKHGTRRLKRRCVHSVAPRQPLLDRLNRERDLVGIYLSAHPLDEFSIVLEHVCNTRMADLEDKEIGRAHV